MSLLIHFSEPDLSRITVADAPDPMWEILLGLHALQTTDAGAVIGHWRASVERTTATRGLFRIAPARGYSPDFLTPEQGAFGLDAGLEAVLGTPTPRLRTDVQRLAAERSVPGWAKEVATGNRTVLRELVDALRTFHRTALAPYWPSVAESVHDDRRARADTMLDAGLGGLLSGLHPLLTWRGNALELHGGHVTGELFLAGRGLRLVPSFFCHGVPTVLADPTLRPVLVYPIAIDLHRLRPGMPTPDNQAAALAALLGKTRAQLLLAASQGRTTTELGRQAGISVASASYHVSILRDAGLIETRRDGIAVRHTLTCLGTNLLAQRQTKSLVGA
ncbi:winged helix-turn-helix domain-containing protein [Actinocrispum sp. NPDC049592]|uniref:ArsR/SmtB family transcription factor n=1 Tax=Actinocrispum sp. NPDC049592 TaxID=3154835 RepID=UPI003431BFE3